MKILLDQNISYKIIKKISQHYSEVTQVGRLGMAQTDDGMIWQFARTHGYVIVTFDTYFHERNLISGEPIKVIWLRCEDTSTDNISNILINNQQAILEFYQSEDFICLELYE